MYTSNDKKDIRFRLGPTIVSVLIHVHTNFLYYRALTCKSLATVGVKRKINKLERKTKLHIMEEI